MNTMIASKLNGIAQHFRKGGYSSFSEMFAAKRRLLILFAVFLLAFMALRTVIALARFLTVFEFAFLVVLFGLAPAYYLRKVFGFSNIIGWLTNAGAMGVVLIPFIFLAAGWLGINALFTYSIAFLYAGAILGMLALLFADDGTIVDLIGFKDVHKFDVLAYSVILASTLLLTVQNFLRVQASWDTFTFWGLAAKAIYLYNRLPDSSFDVLTYFSYTAFHPIYFTIIYDLYHTIVEQYASWINVFFNFLAMMLVYNRARGKSLITKAVILPMIVAISFSAPRAVLIASMYADTLCAFLILLYLVILTNDQLSVGTYSQRAGLLLLVTTAFFFIKSPFLLFTALLVGVWAVYDGRFVLTNLKALARRWDIWFVLAAVLSLYLLRYLYFTFNIQAVHQSDLVRPETNSISATLNYIGEFVNFLLARNLTLVLVWAAGLSSAFWFIGRKKDLSKAYLAAFFLSFSIFSLYCFVYILNQRSITSGSIVRYTSIVMYLAPLLMVYAPLRVHRNAALPLTVLLCFIAGFYLYQLSLPITTRKTIQLYTGSYAVHLQRHAVLASKALRIAGKDARILIADEIYGAYANMHVPAIYVRYFMMENSVGVQYARLPKEQLFKYAQQYKADYILLLSQDDVFDGCQNVFKSGHDYLVKVRPQFNYDDLECPFTQNALIDLTKQNKP